MNTPMHASDDTINALVEDERQFLEPRTPLDTLHAAIARGVDVEQLRALMELEERWHANEAKRAYNLAVAAFRAEALTIPKQRTVTFNGQAKYRYASLADALEIAVPRLSAHGLSHRWDIAQDGLNITVRCVLTHERGHSESAPLTGQADTSGGKNAIQAVGSAVMYLQRYTFLAVTGLAASDVDDDGQGGRGEVITAKQAADLAALMDEVGIVGARYDAALKAFHVERLEDILARDYAAVVEKVGAKRK